MNAVLFRFDETRAYRPTVLATRDDTHLHMEFELLQLAWQTASLFTVEVERLHAGAAIEHVMRLLRSADTLAAVSICYIYRGVFV